MTVSMSHDLAAAAAVALRQVGDTVNADAVDRLLNPPKIWVLRGPAADIYDTFLSYNTFSGKWEFAAGREAVLFTDETRQALERDGQLTPAFSDQPMTFQQLIGQIELDHPFDDERPGLTLADVHFEEAPCREDGAWALEEDAEVDFCEILTSVGTRADAMRHDAPAQ
jgi:hypothetical protein